MRLASSGLVVFAKGMTALNLLGRLSRTPAIASGPRGILHLIRVLLTERAAGATLEIRGGRDAPAGTRHRSGTRHPESNEDSPDGPRAPGPHTFGYDRSRTLHREAVIGEEKRTVGILPEQSLGDGASSARSYPPGAGSPRHEGEPRHR